MSSIRKKASKFFRIRSSSGSEAFSNTNAPFNQPRTSRSKSLPLTNLSSATFQSSQSLGHDLEPSETPTLEPKPELASKSVVESPSGSPNPASPALPFPTPSPGVISGFVSVKADKETMEVTALALVADKADEVIDADAQKAIARAEREEEVRIFQAFNTSLQLKSAAEDIVSHINSGLGEDPWFMRALDDVAKLHPFVSVAVLAFKAVYTLEMTRRQNDKRIIALHQEMKDMIEVLTRLKDIKDPDIIGPNGRAIEARMQSLVAGAAQDIKDCANVCDTWMKKKVLMKVLVGPAWEGKLAGFSATFNSRRMQFEFALQIHTASAVDQIQVVTTAMNDKLAALTQHFIEAFSQLRPPEEARLSQQIEQQYKGGVTAIRTNEEQLRKVFAAEGQKDTNDDGGQSTKKSEYNFRDFTQELREDLDTSVQKNLEAFEGKFKLYFKDVETNLHKYMREEGDRVINEVNRGPHDLIRDPELKIIWKEMHWRRNVKARPFVVTIRDHFIDRLENASSQSIPTSEKSDNVVANNTDPWIRQYIDVKYLQSIMDAIDDDGSAHITIAEINRFTEQLPTSLGWNLSHWLAYWAIGWQTFAFRYCQEIQQTYARMFAMRANILPANRGRAEYYLSNTWCTAAELSKSLEGPVADLPDYALDRFKEYVEYEEDRIRSNLLAIKYDIDAQETVYAVLGPGRIEKNILTLMCLMLRKDLELFRLATKVELHQEEFWDAADSLINVFMVIARRYRELVAQFRQQKIDVDQQMKVISCQFFKLFHDSSLWKMSQLTSVSEVEVTDDDLPSARLPADVPPNNYPIRTEWPYTCDVYDREPEVLSESDKAAPDHIKSLLGEWNGFIHDDDGYALKTITSFFAHAAPADADHHIEATRTSGLGLTFHLTATITQVGDSVKVRALVRYNRDLEDRYFSGYLEADGSIVGSQGFEDDETQHTASFIWKQIPAGLMALRPLPPYLLPGKEGDEPAISKARVLFDYAIRAIIAQNRKKAWSWSHFRQRRDDRKNYVNVCNIHASYGYDMSRVSAPMRHRAFHSIADVDRDFYESIWDRDWEFTPRQECYCDTCGQTCYGIRLTCLNCLCNVTEAATFENSVDFDTFNCAETTIHPKPHATKTPHTPSHDLLKTRVVVTERDLPVVYQRAVWAADACRAQFAPAGERSQVLDQGDKITEAARSTSDQPADESKPSLKCGICHRLLSLPCWSCVDCYMNDSDAPLYVCDECEEKTLLQCCACKTPFKQPRWFYGTDSRDNFMCNKCEAKRTPPVPMGEKPHTYLHHFVRCHLKEESVGERSTDDRIIAVETTVSALDDKITAIEKRIGVVDDKLGPTDTTGGSLNERMSRLEGSMERIERLLAQLASR